MNIIKNIGRMILGLGLTFAIIFGIPAVLGLTGLYIAIMLN